MTKDLNDVIRLHGIEAARRELDAAETYQPPEEELEIAGENVFQLRPKIEQPALRLVWLDMSSWDNEPVPRRDWIIPNRVPAEQFGLFSGEGGVGKSIIELQKDVAHVTGKDWFGSLPEPGPAIYIGTEDTAKELHIRLAAITRHYGVSFKDVIVGGLHVLPIVDEDATLCTVSRSGTVDTTALYRLIYEAAADIKPVNISIDPLTSVFAGNEIDRVQVYAFRRHMMALAKVTRAQRYEGSVFGGSVTLLSHPSLSGLASGSGLSGSTAWHGAPRFRHYLKSIKDEEGEQPDNELRELEFKKVQYGPAGESIVLKYDNGVFAPVRGASDIEQAAHNSRVDDMFLQLLRQYDTSGRKVSHNKNANNYAPAMFAGEPDAKKEKLKRADFEAAMARLFSNQKLKSEPYGSPSRGFSRLVGRR
jgi:RecA-family ATPase